VNIGFSFLEEALVAGGGGMDDFFDAHAAGHGGRGGGGHEGGGGDGAVTLHGVFYYVQKENICSALKNQKKSYR